MKHKNIVAILLIFACEIGTKTCLFADDALTPVPTEKLDDQTISKLIQQLDNDDQNEREEAQAKLIEIGTPAKAALQSAVKDGSNEVKSRSEIICKVFDLNEKLSPKIREAYPKIEVELACNNKNWVKYFLQAGEQKESDFPSTDLETLGAGALRNLKDFDPPTVRQVFGWIERLKLKRLTFDLVEIMKADSNLELRSNAVEALGRLGAKEAIPEIIARLKKDTSAFVRCAVIDALGRLKAKAAVPEIIILLKDVHSVVRTEAVDSLRLLDAKDAIPDILESLKDEDSCVRYAAVEALGRLGAKAAIPELITRLKDEDTAVRYYTAHALVQLDAKESIPELIRVSKEDPDESVRILATGTLACLGEKVDTSGLIELLNDADFRIKVKACDLLARLKMTSAIPKIKKLLAERDQDVSRAAKAALEKLQSEK